MSAVTITADAELEAMVAIAALASHRIRQIYAEHLAHGVDVEEKAPGDPVTRADKEANELICAELESRLGAEAIVAEESVPSAAELANLVKQQRVYFVDPLDGTKEFVNKNGEFAVMIGVAVGGRAAAGVVALPAEDLIYAGRVGTGAFRQTSDGERRFVGVSACERFNECRMLVSRSHLPPLIQPLRKRLGIGAPHPCGSVGVKVTRICEAQADLYVHAGRGMKLWDSCAPEALLTAAGGRLSDLDGASMSYATSELGLPRGLVASNGTLHPGALSAVPWAERQLAKRS